MYQNATNSKRLAKNTLFLYFRMILIMVVSLYTSRVVLNALGVEDYGLYNAIGGLVAMFGIANGALGVSVSRFLNIEMGRGNTDSLNCVFSTSVTIHVLLAIAILIIAESVGPWFVVNKMTIPQERIVAALWVFHFSVLTFAVNLISVPYNGCIIAHENMKVYAYVSVLEVILKLSVAYCIAQTSFDKLKVYGMLIFAVAIAIRAIYQLYCRKHYRESRFNFSFDKKMIREMFSFASWNLVGSTSVIFAEHGVNILINLFCSPIANAARGLASQVSAAVGQFVGNFMTALNPQITKSYGAGDMLNYRDLMFKGSKYSVILLSMLSIPIFLNAEYILRIWLKIIPDHSVHFVRLVLIFSISEAFSKTLTTGLLATGNVKKLMIIVAGTRLMNFPLSYLALLLWGIPELTYAISIVLSQSCLLFRLFLLRKHIAVDILGFYTNVVLKLTIIILATCFLTISFVLIFKLESMNKLIITTLISELILSVLVYSICLNMNEKALLTKTIKKIKFNYVI